MYYAVLYHLLGLEAESCLGVLVLINQNQYNWKILSNNVKIYFLGAMLLFLSHLTLQLIPTKIIANAPKNIFAEMTWIEENKLFELLNE